MDVEFIGARNPLHRVNPDVIAKLRTAQLSVFSRAFSNAYEVLCASLEDVKISVAVPSVYQDEPPEVIGERPYSALYVLCRQMVLSGGVSGDQIVHLHAANLAQRIHMIRAFDEPDRILAFVRQKVVDVVQAFPESAADIEVGRNPGDVLDPFILSATQHLLYRGSFDAAIGATVAHKALMMIEGLLGHLHEDIIGEFRGNVRSPEPRGYNQELLDPFTNPFPGADIVQPPSAAGRSLRFHQVKSKTGSAKGGDGKRLGEQLLRLQQYYDGETFYDALIGNTLRGHRSMNGVLKASPETTVLVGAAAFRELTGSAIGPQLLMRVYRNAFSEAARATGYSIQKMAQAITRTFKLRAEALGEEYVETLVHSAIEGPGEQQDSRTYAPRKKR